MKKFSTISPPDPYRFFFPMGTFLGLLGVGIWPAYVFHWIPKIASTWHMDLQLQGFLFSFVLGFLLTALPRFSLTWHATWLELILMGLVCLVGNLFTIFGFYLLGRCGYTLNFLLLLIFALRRFSKRKSDPPHEFILVGFGLITGLVASFLRIYSLASDQGGWAEILGRRLLTEGMMTYLVLGIGGKLTPMFSGFSITSPLIPKIGQKSSLDKKHFWFLGVALCLALSFPLEYVINEKWGLWFRAIAASFIFFPTMRIHKIPKTGGTLVKFLWFSNWAVLLSLFGSAIHPLYRTEVLHFLFIGGFALMILSIATRVILSHGNHPLELEKKSLALRVGGSFMVLALILRTAASLFIPNYFELLALAGIFWVLGLSSWGIVFSVRAIRTIKT